MRGHQAQPQPRRARRHGGRADRGDVDPLVEKAFGHRDGALGRADDDRKDVAGDVRDVESGRAQLFAETFGSGEQAGGPLGLAAGDFDGRTGRGGGRRRQAGREDERARAVDEGVGQRARAGDVGAETRQRLAERADVNVDGVGQAQFGGDAGAARAEDAGGVRLVDHQPRTGVVRCGDDVGERRAVAVHREHRFGDDQTPARTGVRAQHVAERTDVVVRVDGDLGARQAARVDDARVVQFVAHDDVAAADRRGDGGDVGLVSGRQHQRAFGSLPIGDRPFEIFVRAHVPGDQSRRHGAGAVVASRVAGRGDDVGVGREPEIVVRAKQQHAPAFDVDGCVLRTGDLAQAAAQSARVDVGKVAGQCAVERCAVLLRFGHGSRGRRRSSSRGGEWS